jgi:hypothetical protein
VRGREERWRETRPAAAFLAAAQTTGGRSGGGEGAAAWVSSAPPVSPGEERRRRRGDGFESVCILASSTRHSYQHAKIALRSVGTCVAHSHQQWQLTCSPRSSRTSTACNGNASACLYTSIHHSSQGARLRDDLASRLVCRACRCLVSVTITIDGTRIDSLNINRFRDENFTVIVASYLLYFFSLSLAAYTTRQDGGGWRH